VLDNLQIHFLSTQERLHLLEDVAEEGLDRQCQDSPRTQHLLLLLCQCLNQANICLINSFQKKRRKKKLEEADKPRIQQCKWSKRIALISLVRWPTIARWVRVWSLMIRGETLSSVLKTPLKRGGKVQEKSRATQKFRMNDLNYKKKQLEVTSKIPTSSKAIRTETK